MNIEWLGPYHYLFVHFPIALVIMAGIAELMMKLKKDLDLHKTVTFLLVFAFILILPTIGTGLILEERVESSMNESLIEWHETFAFATLAFAALTLFFRWWKGRHWLYFFSLAGLIACVSLTAHFGGVIAFGPMNYLPS